MDDPNGGYVLYYHPYSVCSLMVLLTLGWRGASKTPDDEIVVQTKLVDIFHEEQLDERFLCEINDHGQVPVLAHATRLEAPIADSLDITFWLATKFPSLMPSEHSAEIQQYLKQLHALNYFSLSFPGRAYIAQGFEDAVNKRLSQTEISDRYRKALEFKLGVIKRDKSGGLVPAVTTKNEESARELLAALETRLGASDSFLFGPEPSALDAHLAVFIARMQDVGRDNLIPPKLREFGTRAKETPEWVKMMDGRSTMVPQK